LDKAVCREKRDKAGVASVVGISSAAFFCFLQTLYHSGFYHLLTKMIQKIFGSDLQLLIFATRFEIDGW